MVPLFSLCVVCCQSVEEEKVEEEEGAGDLLISNPHAQEVETEEEGGREREESTRSILGYTAE